MPVKEIQSCKTPCLNTSIHRTLPFTSNFAEKGLTEKAEVFIDTL